MYKEPIFHSLTDDDRFFILKFFNILSEFKDINDENIDAQLSENLLLFTTICEHILKHGNTIESIKKKVL